MNANQSSAALCRGAATNTGPLTAHSRGRGNWDCVRQMQMYRRRPDVLAAALRDMGINESGDEVTDDPCEPHGSSANN